MYITLIHLPPIVATIKVEAKNIYIILFLYIAAHTYLAVAIAKFIFNPEVKQAL
jgi:hypothetical protein